jgi:hypothetical protein
MSMACIGEYPTVLMEGRECLGLLRGALRIERRVAVRCERRSKFGRTGGSDVSGKYPASWANLDGSTAPDRSKTLPAPREPQQRGFPCPPDCS